ncbi:hypothetical protein D4R99_04815 [bacterium]|nr:MAG: hypothetical protein D4R99_04815 [bacterium]
MKDENKFENLLKKYDENMQRHFSKATSEIKEEMKQHTGALLEEFQCRLSVVAEGVMGLNDKVDGLTDRLDRVENKVDNLENKVDNLENKVDNLENKVDNLENRFDRVENTLNSHTEMIGELMENVSEIKIELKNKVNQKDFIELKQHVLVMES